MHYVIMASAFILAFFALQTVYARGQVYKTITIERRRRH